MTIYRNKKTNRLVYIARVSPRRMTGSFYEEQDIYTGVCKKLVTKAISRIGHSLS